MREYVKMALRNLIRHKRRSLLTGTGMALAAFILVLNQAHSDGLRRQLLANLIAADSGHIRMTAVETTRKNSLEETFTKNHALIAGPEIMTRELLRDPEVTEVKAQMVNNVMLSGGLKTKPGIIVGIEPEKERYLLTQAAPLMTGEPLQAGGRPAAYISNGVAEQFALGLGDTLRVMARTVDGKSRRMSFKVTGVFKTYSPRMTNYVFIRLSDAQELSGAGNGVTQLKIFLKNAARAKNRAAIWQKKYGVAYRLQFTAWEEAGKFYAGTVIAFQFFGLVLSLMLFIVSGFGMMNTMLMAVFSRTREIGTMMALGMKRRQITCLFLTEAVLLGATAASIGVLLGGILVSYLHMVGIPALNESLRFAYENDRTYPMLSYNNILGTFAFVTGLAMLASFYPVYSASHVKPVEALTCPQE